MGKKVFMAVMVFVIILLLGVVGFKTFQVKDYQKDCVANDEGTLSFDEFGKFKIMIIADVQEGAHILPYTMKLIEEAIRIETPDLVVFTGDNIYGMAPDLMLSKDNVEKSISSFLQPIIEKNIPFAVVFGNHDGQGLMTNEEQMGYYRTFQGCLAKDGEDLTGTGNYNIMLMDSADDSEVLNLWFFDSGSYADVNGEESYACVAKDQLDWYLKASQKITENNNGKVVPAFVFQHIPVPEIYNCLTEVDQNTKDAVVDGDKYYILNEEAKIDGTLKEHPCSPFYNTGEFAAWKQAGDVITAFFGHDHVNDFTGIYDGIKMTYTPGCGFYSYGDGYNRGIRVVELDETDITNYTTHVIHYSDISTEKISNEKALYDGYVVHGKSLASYITIFAVIPLIIVVCICIFIIRKVKKYKLNKKNKMNQ